MSDIVWLLGCSGLVFLMQPGFMCLESGLTRSKNSINVAVKNLADVSVSVILFWFFGYALMFGASTIGFIGSDGFFLEIDSSPKLAAFFLFQAMFCGTTTTIVSGAVAERLRFKAYLIIALLISGLVYPLFGHWAWNGMDVANPTGWLGKLGFVDFAGSTVVHSVGGWVAFAALLVIGPRKGRFKAGKSNKIHGSNLPFSVLGAMLLWLGWLGFNGGSTFALNEEVPRIVVHTIIAGATGMVTAGIIGWQRSKHPEPEVLINGSIAGLVSITAACNAVTVREAALIGAMGGAIMLLATYLMERWYIDDGVDAFAIHGAAGMWGTLAVAWFGDPDIIGTGLGHYSQLGVQLLGIGVAFIWAFGLTYLVLVNTNRIFPLRVSEEEEDLGLNVSEHQAKTEVYALFQVMDEQARTQDFSLRVPEDPYTEAGKIAYRYNQVMNSLEGYAHQLEDLNTHLEEKVRARTAELAEANLELKRLDRLKDEFLANTSHELRTPLNGIIGIADSLLDGATGPLPQATYSNLAMIANSGRRLANLVNDVLDFSKITHNKLQLQLKSVGLREIVELVLTVCQSLVGSKNIKLINDIPSNLPPGLADENRLQQILYNLVGNGIKFTDAGWIRVSAKLGGKKKSQIHLTVADTGIGIREDVLPRIFESFVQADGSTARKYGGAGLGLAVTKQLVELHQGKIWVQSKVKEGSQFTFTLPIADGKSVSFKQKKPPAVLQQENQLPIQVTQKELSESIPDEDKFKILIVDDEPVNIQVLINHLSLENYALMQASDGVEALEKIKHGFQPDLILLDVMMPKMTGYEVTKKLRQNFLPTELPILMLTAKNQISDLVEGLTSGANDYLTKPINKKELLSRIKTHLELANINQAYGRFVPHEFLHLLNKESILDLKVGEAVQKDMSILFSDIRSFTTLSERMSVEENFKFINAYLSRMESAIIQNNGFIDKYIGDAIMALFSHDADDAVKAGIAMLTTLRDYNKTRQRPDRKPLKIGIGINTGSLMIGTVGGENRMDSTVISDAVNVASRIEGLTKNYGVSLLISQQTLLKLNNPSQYAIRLIDKVKVKGKSTLVTVYEVFDADDPEVKEEKLKTKATFEHAWELYNQNRLKEAASLFASCYENNPGDTVAKIYFERCQGIV